MLRTTQTLFFLAILSACSGDGSSSDTSPADSPTLPDTTDTDTTDTDTTDTDTSSLESVESHLEIDAFVDDAPLLFTGAGATCDDGTAVLKAEVVGGADRMWVEAYDGGAVVDAVELGFLSPDLETFQEADGSYTACDMDAWIWHAERGTDYACLVTGPDAEATALGLGCLSI